MISFQPKAKFDKDATIIFIDQDQLKNKSLTNIKNTDVKSQILDLYKNKQFSADSGEIFLLTLGKKRILLIGVGDKEKKSLTAVRILTRKALLSSSINKSLELELIPHTSKDSVVQANY